MKRAPWVVLSAAALAIALLRAWQPATPIDFEQAEAFGAQTTSQFARVAGAPIHCRDARDLEQCVLAVRQAGARPTVLWFGNSQLHAINQYRPGEVTAVSRLSGRLAPAGLALLACSQPSANFQEQLLLYAYLLGRVPVHTLVLPAVYDDTREDGVRDTLVVLGRDSATARTLAGSSIGRRVSSQGARPAGEAVASSAGARAADESPGGGAALAGSLQAGVERRLDDWLTRHSAAWAARETLRGELFNALYVARNTVFGIRSTTHRRRIPGRYAANLEALGEMLRLSRERGVRVLVYVAPIRGDVAMPYDAAGYDGFRRDVQQLAQHYGAHYADLGALVPAPLWGVKAAGIAGTGDTEVDFMHFRAAGHALLAERVATLLGLPGGEAVR